MPRANDALRAQALIKHRDAYVDLYWSDCIWGLFIDKRCDEIGTFLGMVEQSIAVQQAEFDHLISKRLAGLPRGTPLDLSIRDDLEKRLTELHRVFPQELYRNALISVYSYSENIYDLICSETARERGQALPPRRRTNGIELSRKTLQRITGVDFSQLGIWAEVVTLKHVRDACVHAAGLVAGRMPSDCGGVRPTASGLPTAATNEFRRQGIRRTHSRVLSICAGSLHPILQGGVRRRVVVRTSPGCSVG